MIEMVTNDRVVGGLTAEAAELAKPRCTRCSARARSMLTDATTAEMTKLVENAYRDVNIAFANELSVISDNLGIDVWKLIQLGQPPPPRQRPSAGPRRGRPLHRRGSVVHR